MVGGAVSKLGGLALCRLLCFLLSKPPVLPPRCQLDYFMSVCL